MPPRKRYASSRYGPQRKRARTAYQQRARYWPKTRARGAMRRPRFAIPRRIRSNTLSNVRWRQNNTITRMRLQHNQVMPDMLRTSLAYQHDFKFASDTNGVSATFNLSRIINPYNVSHGHGSEMIPAGTLPTHNAKGATELSMLYKKYRVWGAHVELHLQDLNLSTDVTEAAGIGTTATREPMRYFVYLGKLADSPRAVTTDRTGQHMDVVGPWTIPSVQEGTTKVAKFRRFVSLPKMRDQNHQQFLADAENWHLFTTTSTSYKAEAPVVQVHVRPLPFLATAAINTRCFIRIRFSVDLFDPVIVDDHLPGGAGAGAAAAQMLAADEIMSAEQQSIRLAEAEAAINGTRRS